VMGVSYKRDIDDVRTSGSMKHLPPLCRPGGWVALWRRLAMVGALNARIGG